MEIYERIIELRKEHLPKKKNKKSITQNEFGELLGVSRSVIVNIEYNRAPIKDHMIKLICQTFNVNEDWLRNGNEPIFKEKVDDALQEVFEQYDLSKFMQDIVKRYLNLDPKYQQMFEIFIKQMVKDLNVDKNTENEKRNSLILKEEPKQETEMVKIVARDEGVTYITKEEFEEIKRNSKELTPEEVKNLLD